MKDDKSLVYGYWEGIDKHPALQRAINVLKYEVNFGPCASSPGLTLDCQVNISRFIEKHLPEYFFTDLIFDDCGQIVLDRDNEPMTVSKYEDNYWADEWTWYLEQAKEEDPEHSDYWIEDEDGPLDPDNFDGDEWHKSDDGKWYQFYQARVERSFANYEPDWSHITVVESKDVTRIILGDCLELVRV